MSPQPKSFYGSKTITPGAWTGSNSGEPIMTNAARRAQENQKSKEIPKQDIAKLEKLIVKYRFIFDSPYLPSLFQADNFEPNPASFYALCTGILDNKKFYSLFRKGPINLPKYSDEQLLSNMTKWLKNRENTIDFADSMLFAAARSIKQNINLEKKIPPEAPDSAIFQKYIFGQNRSAKSAPREMNTKIENDVELKLRQHYDHAKLLDKTTGMMLAKLGKKGQYSDVLSVPEKYEIAYRGMRITKAALRKLLGKQKPEGSGTVEKNMTYKPRKGSSSWSIRRSVAHGFAEESNGSGEVLIILHSYIETNTFIMNPDAATTVTTRAVGAIESEREVIAVGNVRVFAFEYRIEGYDGH
jgi:hypothetical protein